MLGEEGTVPEPAPVMMAVLPFRFSFPMMAYENVL
jgi:hypothetical protein